MAKADPHRNVVRGSRLVTVRLSDGQYAELKKRADAEGSSISRELKLALDRGLQRGLFKKPATA